MLMLSSLAEDLETEAVSIFYKGSFTYDVHQKMRFLVNYYAPIYFLWSFYVNLSTHLFVTSLKHIVDISDFRFCLKNQDCYFKNLEYGHLILVEKILEVVWFWGNFSQNIRILWESVKLYILFVWNAKFWKGGFRIFFSKNPSKLKKFSRLGGFLTPKMAPACGPENLKLTPMGN